MRDLRLAAAAGMLLLTLGCRSAPLPAVNSFGAGSKELLRRSHELNTAFATRDTAKFQSLLAPEYTLHFIAPALRGEMPAMPFAPRAKIVAKFFADLSNGPLEWSSVDVRVYGDFGVVTSHYRWRASYKSSPFDVEGFITDVWIQRDGEWKILNSTVDVLPAQQW